jgi:flagellar secretion chaperone FliS
MNPTSQGNRYLENDVMSRAPEWLVPFLYEQLLSSLTRASVQIEVADMEGKAASLSRAASIVGELLASLDPTRGEEMARNLSALYAYFVIEIMNIGRSLDRNALERLTSLVRELHEAWVQAAEQVSPRGRRPAGGLGATAA